MFLIGSTTYLFCSMSLCLLSFAIVSFDSNIFEQTGVHAPAHATNIRQAAWLATTILPENQCKCVDVCITRKIGEQGPDIINIKASHKIIKHKKYIYYATFEMPTFKINVCGCISCFRLLLSTEELFANIAQSEEYRICRLFWNPLLPNVQVCCIVS